MELFSLFGKIAVNNSEANTSIGETTEKASSLSDTLSSGMKTAAQWGASVVKGTYTAVSGLATFAESAASATDTIDKMSQKIGISREAYQELDFICSQSGTSVNILQAGIKSLTSAMDGAASGTESNVEQFERLGISVVDANGELRSQEEVMWETMSALQSMENQTEKARLATELFGRSGTELMPLLNGASGSIEEMKQQAHDLGLVLSDDLIDSGVNLTDSLDQTKRAFQSIVIQVGGLLMPVIEKASDFLQTLLPDIIEIMTKLEPAISAVFESLLPPFMDLVNQMLPMVLDAIEQLLPPMSTIIQQLIPVLASVLQAIYPTLVEIITAVLPVVVTLLEAILPILVPILQLLAPILDLVMQLLKPLLNLIVTVLPPLIKLITDIVNVLVNTLMPILTSYIELLTTVFTAVVDSVTEYLTELIDIATEIWTSMKDKVVSDLSILAEFVSTALSKIKSVFTTVFSNVKQFVSGVFDEMRAGVTEKLTNLISKITDKLDSIKAKFKDKFEDAKNTVKSAIEAIKGFFDFKVSLPSIKLPHFSINPLGWKYSDLMKGSIPKLGVEWYAKGGIVDEATAFGMNGDNLRVAGEAGKEAIIPLENNTKGIELIANKISEIMAPAEVYDDSEVIARLDALLESFHEFIKTGIYLDSGALVGQLTPAFDSSFGSLDDIRKRGG